MPSFVQIASNKMAQSMGFSDWDAYWAALPPEEQAARVQEAARQQQIIDEQNSAQRKAFIAGIATFGIGAIASSAFTAPSSSTSAPPMPPAIPPSQGAAPMSLLGNQGVMSSLGGILGNWIPGVGQQAGVQLGSALSAAYGGLSEASIAQPVALPGLAGIGAGIARLGPAVVGGVAATGVMAARGVATVARSAAAYCRRHPGWCASIGGISAVANLVQSGQLPPMRRRRARGISPAEFRGFRKVHRVLSGFCAPRMRIRRKGR